MSMMTSFCERRACMSPSSNESGTARDSTGSVLNETGGK
jgi:hypothetical protein